MSSKRKKQTTAGDKNPTKSLQPKKERWLFTRKTWKYMQDAGRKLVPDGKNPNNPEDFARIEEHFNKICKSESKFLVWRRKSSFPESIIECRSRKKLIAKQNKKLSGLNQQQDEFDHEKQDQYIIDSLEQYLNSVKKQSKLCDPNDTSIKSTSYENLGATPKIRNNPSFKISLDNLNKKFNLIWHHHHNRNSEDQLPTTVAQQLYRPPELDINAKVELIKCIKYYIKNNKTNVYNYNHLRSIDNLFNDFFLLEQFLLELKREKFNVMFKKCTLLNNKPISASMSNLDQIQLSPNFIIPKIQIKHPSFELTNSAANGTAIGIQTDRLSIAEIKQWYNEQKAQGDGYSSHESDNDILDQHDENERGRNRRKSSIDNEDVSESVSNTIKRYLKMARKKPNSKKDDANRFKRINYDKNLRNIKTKNKFISILAIDTDTDKGCQTENVWLEHLLSLFDDRNPHKIYNNNKHSEYNSSNGESTSPQSSPKSKQCGKHFFTGLLTLSSNNDSNESNTSNQILASTSTTAANQLMQKSKSSSNVGHLVSKKIWKTRSKSQSRAPSTFRPMWTPQGDGIWTTPQGKRVMLTNTRLQNLTELERKMLHRVAIEKLQQLNFGINVSAPDDQTTSPSEAGSTTTTPTKKHRTLLLKRKALTTGFFDMGKDKDDKTAVTQGLVFGLSLEQCINNDSRLNKENQTGRTNHNSFNSLLDTKRDKSKLQTASCESLPTIPTNLSIAGNLDDDRAFSSNTLAIMTSLSQSDLSKTTIMDDYGACDISGRDSYVPIIVTECIRHLEQYGLQTIGLFRVSSSRKRVRQLREEFDRGLITKLDSTVTPHDVATLLKEFLRDLPEPLLCQKLYSAFVKTQKIRNRRLQLESLSHLVQLLPVAHRDTLYVLLRFLAKVGVLSQDVIHAGEIVHLGNKMDSNNLATVFAPNILRSPPTSRQTTEQQVEERLDAINVIRTMIDHYEDIFTISSEMLDEIYTTMIDVQPDQFDNCFEMRTGGCEIHSDPLYHSISLAPSDTGSDDTSTGELRKIYSRENLLHENTVIGPNVESSKSRHKDRTPTSTKMKYQDGQNLNSSRLREYAQQYQYYQTDNDDDIHSRNPTIDQKLRMVNFPSKSRSLSTDSASYATPLFSSSTSIDLSRRMSSPLLISNEQQQQYQQQQQQQQHQQQGPEILTASLQIPVQLQHSSSGNNAKLNVGDEYSDIPYIEEGCNTTPIIDHHPNSSSVHSPITGMLSVFDTNSDHRSNTKTITLTTSSSSSSKNNRSAIGPQNRKLSQSSSLSKIRLDSVSKHPATLSLSSPTTGSSSYTFEPKITPSITNIGDAVMKSKTAGFEKKIDTDRSIDSKSMSIIQQSASTSAIPSSVMGIGGAVPSPVKRRTGQMYKRQEIISSVHAIKK